MVLLSLTWVEFLLSRKAFTAESVYVYTYEMFTELPKRRYLGKTSQSKHGISRAYRPRWFIDFSTLGNVVRIFSFPGSAVKYDLCA